MIQFKQHRPFFDTSSSTWMLLLLSLYFSWICPTESVDPLRGFDITLVGQQSIEAQDHYYQCRFKAPKSFETSICFPVFSFQEHKDCFQLQGKASWCPGTQRQNLLPAPSTFYQFQTHLPRSIAIC